ncbi:MAG: hypothetical protein IEMM0008_1886 [bacterium]|nr:MAG: hypothetical protein IEMM0008_1886 [bacterium]
MDHGFVLKDKIMGKVTEKVKVRNYGDILKHDEGLIKESLIRSIELEAVVDTGAAYLCLSPDSVKQLGLRLSHSRGVITANGKVERRIFHGAEITIQGRTIEMQVMENDRTTLSLIGYLVLQAMDFVVEPRSERIIGNPEHDGEWIIDLY